MNLIQIGIAAHYRSAMWVNDPSDVGLGIGLSQGLSDWAGQKAIPNRAQLDDQNSHPRNGDTREQVQLFALTCFDDQPGLRWLFAFAHPDDELAIAAWMHHLVQRGVHVSAIWAHATPIRRAEALNAAELIGISAEQCSFGSAIDGRFIDDLPGLKAWVANELGDGRFDRVVTVAFEQGHLDHDALNFAVNQSFSGAVLEFPMYWHYGRILQRIGRFADSNGEATWSIDVESAALLTRLLECYPSQSVKRNVRLYQRLSRPENGLFNDERLRLQPTTDWRTPTHAGRMRARVESSAKWKRWLAAIEREVG